MKRRTILIVLVVVVAIGGFVAWRMWNKPHDKVEDEKGIVITATDLCNAFATDEAKANQQYLNKALEVSGIAASQELNQDGKTVVTLTGTGTDLSVLCTMRDKGTTITAGQPVTIKGKCSGSDMFGVLLTGCVLQKP